jgi:hypothetical protein
LTAFCLSAMWQICETLYLLLRVQECRFTIPSQDAGTLVLSMGDGRLTHLPFRSPDPRSPPSETSPHLLLGRGVMSHLFHAGNGRWGREVVLVSGVDPCSLQRTLIELDEGLMHRQR